MGATRVDEQVAVIDRFDGEHRWLANQSLHRSGYGGHGAGTSSPRTARDDNGRNGRSLVVVRHRHIDGH